ASMFPTSIAASAAPSNCAGVVATVGGAPSVGSWARALRGAVAATPARRAKAIIAAGRFIRRSSWNLRAPEREVRLEERHPVGLGGGVLQGDEVAVVPVRLV